MHIAYKLEGKIIELLDEHIGNGLSLVEAVGILTAVANSYCFLGLDIEKNSAKRRDWESKYRKYLKRDKNKIR